MKTDISDRHFKDYTKLPDVVEVIPGVIRLAGGFADCCKGVTLCACREGGLAVSVSLRTDNNVRVSNVPLNDHKRFNINTIKYRREDRWGNYVKGTFAGIISEGKSLPGLNMVLDGPVLSGDGETVASAVGIGVCMALNRLLNLNLDKNAIARIVFSASTQFCGERCSYSTLLTVLDYHSGCYAFFDLLRMNCMWVPDPFKDSGYKIVLIDACMPTSALRDEITQCCKSVNLAVSRLKEWCHSSVRDFPENELRSRSIPLGEADRRVCTYVLGEYKSIIQIQKAFENRDIVSVGKNFLKIAKLTGENLELSCPEMDWIIKRCDETSGCLGSCIVYGYSGSNVAAVIRDDALVTLRDKLEDYEHIFGFRYKMDVFSPMKTEEQ